LAWNIADYLLSLEKGVGELLMEKDALPSTPDPPKPEAGRP
jgi:hypothetical protein